MLLAINLATLSLGEIISAFAIVIAVITSITTLAVKVYKSFIKAHELKTRNDDLKETVVKHGEEITDIKDILKTLAISLEKQEKENKKVDCALLRDRIIQSYQQHKKHGMTNALDYENLNEMFIQYFNRGGNHLVTKIYKDFQTWGICIEETEN